MQWLFLSTIYAPCENAAGLIETDAEINPEIMFLGEAFKIICSVLSSGVEEPFVESSIPTCSTLIRF